MTVNTEFAAHQSDAPSPFHAGERALQERARVRERLEQVGRRVIRDYMPEQHREFFPRLPFLIAGSLDARGRPWASMLVGRPGFVTSPDRRTLEIRARPLPGDPAAANFSAGGPLGLLGIELETRRRNRANGTLGRAEGGGLVLHVEESFGNCPRYIQARDAAFVADPATAAPAGPARPEGPALSAAAAALVASADTFFIATSAPTARRRDGASLDVSHRGGRPGFVRVASEGGRTVLTAPDFAGNLYFNTLGNLLLDPRAGLLFVDFAAGSLLSLTGAAEIVHDGPELAAFAGAERLLRFRVAEGVALASAVPLRWSAPRAAPEVAATGRWPAPA
jgi:uncharacterized protein